MAAKFDNQAILIIIAVALLGILGMLIIKAAEKTPEEKVADSVSEAVEDIGNAVAKQTE
jgi:hypothetical protein